MKYSALKQCAQNRKGATSIRHVALLPVQLLQSPSDRGDALLHLGMLFALIVNNALTFISVRSSSKRHRCC